jgi:hypothetical protein
VKKYDQIKETLLKYTIFLFVKNRTSYACIIRKITEAYRIYLIVFSQNGKTHFSLEHILCLRMQQEKLGLAEYPFAFLTLNRSTLFSVLLTFD